MERGVLKQPLPARRPGPRPSLPEVSTEERLLLLRLQRLRVLTSFQAHWLVDSFHALNPDTQRPLTERNTRMRLQRLSEEGFLKVALTEPERGGYSGFSYRLGGKGLRALGIPEEKNLLRRPAVEVLRYLLLRNEVYAQGRRAGWQVVSPLLFEESQHSALLAQVRHWVLGRLEERAAQGDRTAEAQLQQGRAWAPQRLTFDCLLRDAPGQTRAAELVLVVVDDVRRAIVPVKRNALVKDTPPAPTQVEELPPLLADAGLVLRDTQSRWNTTTQKLEQASPRLRQWRRVLSSRYGEQLLESDTLFAGLWSQRTHSPGEG